MTHEELMYHWLQEAERYEREAKLPNIKTSCEVTVKIELAKQARLFYMMLYQMEKNVSKITTGTTIDPVISISSIDIEPEYVKLINDNFFDLLSGDSSTSEP